MNDQSKNLNPYSAPKDPVEQPTAPYEKELPPLATSLAKWTVICAVSAAPSFVMGLNVSQHALAVPAMLFGVLCFILAYTYVVRRPISRRLMARRPAGACIASAFGLRVMASVFFPIGIGNDIWIGFLSMTMTQSITGDTSNMEPWAVLFTTIIQGLLLNVELFLVAILLLGVAQSIRFATRSF